MMATIWAELRWLASGQVPKSKHLYTQRLSNQSLPFSFQLLPNRPFAKITPFSTVAAPLFSAMMKS